MKNNKSEANKSKRQRRLAPATCWAYHPTYIKEIKAAAMKLPGVKSVSHIRPRAYCIAKPAASCAVFVTPPCDAEPQLRQMQNATAETIREGVSHVKVGEWYVLAYVTIPNYVGQSRVIDMPNAPHEPRRSKGVD